MRAGWGGGWSISGFQAGDRVGRMNGLDGVDGLQSRLQSKLQGKWG